MWIIASLIFFGILFLIIEFLLTAGFGIAGILGLASLAGACVYAFMKVSTTAGILVTLFVIALVVATIILILRSKTWKKLELKTEIDSKANVSNEKVAVGEKGIAMTRLAPMGTGRIGVEELEVKSFDGSMISAGTEIEVVEINDNKVIVKPIKNK